MSRFGSALAFVMTLAPLVAAFAADLTARGAAALEAAGVPLYPDATFCIGSPEVGLRFATAAEPATVRAWYLEQLPAWALYADVKLDIWVLYDGPPDVRTFADVMAFNHLVVQANADLPEWHDLPAGTTTELMIMATLAAAPAAGDALALIPAMEGWQAPDVPKQSAPDGVVGTLHRTQDMESEDERYYFYVQDDAYMEHIIAYEDELPEAVAARLDVLADGERVVRVVGELFVDEAMGTSMFDRSQELRVVADE